MVLEAKKQSRITFWLNSVMVVCGLGSVGELVALAGWTLEAQHVDLLCGLSFGTILTFFVQEIFRLFYVRTSVLQHVREHWFETLLLVLIPCILFSSLFILERISQDVARTHFGVLHLLIVAIIGLRAVRSRHKIAAGTALTPGRVFILSFAILILTGTLLLMTPRASVSGIGFVDALFFATSAVCVTGLVPVESLPATLTHFGEYILLVLAQLGGLGVMSITYFFAYFFAGGLSLRNRFAFHDLFSEDNISQIGLVLGVMIGFTFSVEAVGAVWIYFSYAGTTEAVANPVFFSVFHAVMAFCNAGFSTLPGGFSTGTIAQNMPFIGAIALIASLGALGFPVVKNFWLVALDCLRRKVLHKKDHAPVRFTTHSKLVLVTTLVLFLAGTAFIYLSGTVPGANAPERLANASFLSLFSRTSGFSTVEMSSLASGTLFAMMGLMFIGGAPFSTAGGIKVTTFAVAVLSLRQILWGRRDLEVFGRRLSGDVANQALAIMLLASGFLALTTIALCLLHPEIPPSFLLFEAVSAIATVGLSCDVTPQLCMPAKCVLIGAMFIGRIGILLFLSSFITRRSGTGARRPEATIVLS